MFDFDSFKSGNEKKCLFGRSCINIFKGITVKKIKILSQFLVCLIPIFIKIYLDQKYITQKDIDDFNKYEKEEEEEKKCNTIFKYICLLTIFTTIILFIIFSISRIII